MKKMCYFLILGLLTVTLVGCGGVVNKTMVDATVVDKNFIPSSTYVTMMSTGKNLIPVTHHREEKFNITATYEGMELTFNSKAIYDSANVGDSIKLYKVDVYKKNGTFKKSYLQHQ